MRVLVWMWVRAVGVAGATRKLVGSSLEVITAVQAGGFPGNIRTDRKMARSTTGDWLALDLEGE